VVNIKIRASTGTAQPGSGYLALLKANKIYENEKKEKKSDYLADPGELTLPCVVKRFLCHRLKISRILSHPWKNQSTNQ
jgi:hypothetical protein